MATAYKIYLSIIQTGLPRRAPNSSRGGLVNGSDEILF